MTITERVPLEECLWAVDECGAPMVSICGGEPMMYPQIGQLVAGILERNRHIILCTNGMYIQKRLHEFKPDKRFYFNVHLDGMEKNHDIAVERAGVFRDAIEGIRVAKAAAAARASCRRSRRARPRARRPSARCPSSGRTRSAGCTRRKRSCRSRASRAGGTLTLSIRLEVNNLFDEDYQVILSYPMPRRSFRLTVGLDY